MTTILAIYGAVVGTISIALQVHRFFRDRPRLNLELWPGYTIISTDRRSPKDPNTYTRLTITNLGREVISVSHAYAISITPDGEPQFLLFRESVEARPRPLTAENPRTEYLAEESADFDPRRVVCVGVQDGVGRTHVRWTVPRRRRREAKRQLKKGGMPPNFLP